MKSINPTISRACNGMFTWIISKYPRSIELKNITGIIEMTIIFAKQLILLFEDGIFYPK